MPEFQLGNRTIVLNDDGFMVHPRAWDEDIATELAKLNAVDPLTDDHWAVIRCVRNHYLKYNVGPMVRLICRKTGLEEQKIHELFKACFRGCMCRIAGLPKPTG